MESWLFNIYNKFNQVASVLLSSAPGALRKTADALSLIESGTRQAADFIDQVSPYTVFGAGNEDGFDSGASQGTLAEIAALRDRFLDAAASPPAAPQHHEGALPAAHMGILTPSLVSLLAQLAAEMLSKVLVKAGFTPNKPTVSAG